MVWGWSNPVPTGVWLRDDGIELLPEGTIFQGELIPEKESDELIPEKESDELIPVARRQLPSPPFAPPIHDPHVFRCPSD